MEKVIEICGIKNIPAKRRFMDAFQHIKIVNNLFVLFVLLSMMTPGTLSAQYHPQDSILFETNTVPVKIWDEATNIWQVGKPQKTYLNGAWSSPKGIITDTATTYPVNTYSIFPFVIDPSSIKPNFSTYLQ